jgi:2-C-methyl-D-erythritol 4-phosphate cytidylyltransferase/2-C-methyl-D-erythritol 2,4-cyclodiphosphate synthase
MAAGKGERLGGGPPKQFRELGGVPVLRRAVVAFADHPSVRRVRVVVPEGQAEEAYRAVGGGLGDVEPIAGGATRGESVRNGLAAIDGDAVLIHDAARPFCPAAVIDRLVAQLEFFDGVVPVLPVNDTLARSADVLGEPIDREGAVRVQTPQAFRLAAIRQAYEQWGGPFPSDDSQVARRAGLRVGTVAGAHHLDKLTTEEDWFRAEEWLADRTRSRTGSGFDVHAFSGDGPLILGGIAIPHSRGLAGHSDADVVLHAVTDALLGAAALGDIGTHFPPSDPQWRGASSDLFLIDAAARVGARGGIIDHIDCTIIAEEPKIGPYRDAMRSRIADILGIDVGKVSIKATTTDGLGFTGRREGIAAQVVATIRIAADG